MKQVVLRAYGAPDVLRVEDASEPRVGVGEVLIEVEAAGINFADLRRRQGTYVEPTQLPFVPGIEVAGTVATTGPNVDNVRPGTRVLGITGVGGYAEFAVAPAAHVVPLPDGVDPAASTALAAQGLTAWLALTETAPLRPGQTVLVNAAAGGVGSLAIQIARGCGAGRVIGTAGAAEKLEVIRRLGADAAVNYTAADWPEQVRRANSGVPVDVVLELVGGDIFARSLNVLAPFGRLVSFGASSGKRPAIEVVRLLAANQTVSGFYLNGFLDRGEMIRNALRGLLDRLAAGDIAVASITRFPLAEAAEAHQAIEARHTTGKVVLIPGSVPQDPMGGLLTAARETIGSPRAVP